MNEEEFLNAYRESRNGANYLVRHPLVPRFTYSDGVQDVAKAGCYWLLDLIATELTVPHGFMTVLDVNVKDGEADITASNDDDAPPYFTKHIDMTDMPEGKWAFYLSFEDGRVVMILPTEY